MPVPWMQIVQLMPSIVEVSKELLKRSRRPTEDGQTGTAVAAGHSTSALEARVAALEENERRQAELVSTMAEQLAQLTTAVTALHRQTRLLLMGQVVTGVVAIVALIVAITK